jgi:hypothetical protein
MDWSLFWTIIGSVAGVLAIIAPFIAWLGNRYRKRVQNEIKKEFEPLVEQNKRLAEENQRLNTEINTRLQMPSYSLEAIKLTEIAAERKVEEITKRYEEAVTSKDQALADTLQSKLREIESLRQSIDAITKERSMLETRLQSAIVKRQPRIGNNAIGLPTGLILLVRHNGKYGAVQAIDQSSQNRGSFIRYAWWYQPDGSGSFTKGNVEFGFGETSEGRPGVTPRLQIGPIQLEWSIGGEGSGWVYFGPKVTPSPDYELLVTNEVDISMVNAEGLANQFIKAKDLRH